MTFLWRLLRVGNPYKKAQVKRVVILGLDGMDPGMATRFMNEGRMPNFKAFDPQNPPPPQFMQISVRESVTDGAPGGAIGWGLA